MDTEAETRTQDDVSLRTRQFAVAVILLWALAALALWRASAAIPSDSARPSAWTQIDPNSAPWWELSLLPNLGDSLSREIARFRAVAGQDGDGRTSTESGAKAGAVFVRAADLEQIRGIGPKTVQRLAKHLRFPDPAQENDRAEP